MGFLVTIDGNLLLWIQKHARFHAWNFFWIAVTSLGNAGIVWLALSVVLLCQRRTREAGQAALLSMGLCFLLCNLILKNLVARTRPYDAIPELTTLIPHPTDYFRPGTRPRLLPVRWYSSECSRKSTASLFSFSPP